MLRRRLIRIPVVPFNYIFVYPVPVTGTRAMRICSRQPAFHSSPGLQTLTLTLILTV